MQYTQCGICSVLLIGFNFAHDGNKNNTLFFITLILPFFFPLKKIDNHSGIQRNALIFAISHNVRKVFHKLWCNA